MDSEIELRFDLTVTGSEADLVEEKVRSFISHMANQTLFETEKIDNNRPRCRLIEEVQVFPPQDGEIKAQFEVKVDMELFPPEYGGVDHLLGILAGDLWSASNYGLFIKTMSTRVANHDVWLEKVYNTFRKGKAHSQADIRNLFKLSDGYPLFGFNIKPRVGLPPADFKSKVIAAAKGGIHIIEADSRSLEHLDMSEAAKLCKLSAEAGGKSRISRYSPNLSVGPDMAVKLYKQYVAKLRELRVEPPYVIKIDGGFNGIATVQAIRKLINIQQPIITSYPYLRRHFNNLVSHDFYIQMLAYSGVDILYPGERPNLPSEKDKDDQQVIDPSGDFKHSINRYNKNYEKYKEEPEKHFPLWSIAGGINAGEIYTYTYLLKGNFSFFLGSAISDHNQGIEKGAKLCTELAKAAAKNIRNNSKRKDLEAPSRLVTEISKSYKKVSYKSLRNARGLLGEIQ